MTLELFETNQAFNGSVGYQFLIEEAIEGTSKYVGPAGNRQWQLLFTESSVWPKGEAGKGFGKFMFRPHGGSTFEQAGIIRGILITCPGVLTPPVFGAVPEAGQLDVRFMVDSMNEEFLDTPFPSWAESSSGFALALSGAMIPTLQCSPLSMEHMDEGEEPKTLAVPVTQPPFATSAIDKLKLRIVDEDEEE